MIALRGASVPGRLAPLSLAIAPGERVLVSGASGSGKTTLLRLLAGLGPREGGVTVGGRDPRALPPAARPRALGWVPQQPDDALVAGTVADELAFGPRCAGLAYDPGPDAAALGLALHRDPRATSSGERQRLVVAGALAAGAGVLCLDEPLAHLDGPSADRLLAALADRPGVAVVLAEHRLARALPWCTRQLALEAGALVRDGPPGPPPPPPPLPLPAPGAPVGAFAGAPLRARERVAVVGPNGAGKTTLLRAHAGPGAVYVPADPDLALFCPTVAAELASGAGRGVDLDALAARLRLGHLRDRSPHRASRGERLRIAVAAALATGAPVLLLDEPTAGQDADAVARLFSALADTDAAVVFATHDADLAARGAHRRISLPAS